MRFLYKVTLKQAWTPDEIPMPKKPFKLPVVLSRASCVSGADRAAVDKRFRPSWSSRPRARGPSRTASGPPLWRWAWMSPQWRMRWSARPEKLHHPRLPMPSACKPTPPRPAGRTAMTPRCTTSATAPSRPRCTAWCCSTRRAFSPRPKRPPAPACRNSSKTSSTPSWSAASWRTASCACAAPIVATTSSWRSVASAAGSVPRAGRGAWRRPLRTWSST